MTLQVDYTKAAKVAVLATATQLYLNQGSLASAFLMEILGNLGVDLCNKVSHEMRNITVLGPGKFQFRILSNLNFAPLASEKEVKKALARVQDDYPEEYEEFSKQYKLFSEDEIVSFFKNDLKKGCCYGTANALFDKICRDIPTSMPESICILQKEDVFYYQILDGFFPNTFNKPDYIDSIAEDRVLDKKLDQILLALKEGKAYDSDSDEDLAIEVEKTKIQKRIENLKRNDHARNFSDSEKFLTEATSNIYREILESAMLAFSDEQDVVGMIKLPCHVMGFQYGPRGYFLSDTLSDGLFEYFDPDTFCAQLRARALYCTRFYYLYDIPEHERDRRKRGEEIVKRERTYYSIRPLRQINPFVEARELPPVTCELSEGWKAFFAQKETWGAFIGRKIESCIHSIALTTLQALGHT